MDFHALNKGLLFMEDHMSGAKRISDNLTGINRSVSLANLHDQISLSFCLEYKHIISTLLTMGIATSFENLHTIFLQHDTRPRLQTSKTHSGEIPSIQAICKKVAKEVYHNVPNNRHNFFNDGASIFSL